MKTDFTVTELVRMRTSKRNYLSGEFDDHTRANIGEILKMTKDTPFNCDMEFKLIENTRINGRDRFGTYGMITGANNYIAGKVKKTQYDLEDFGYAFERIILKLTGLGLGTCWLGGALNRSEFHDIMNIRDDEFIPAVTPVGFTRSYNFREKMIRFVIKAKKRKPWNELFFNEKKLPLSESKAGGYKLPLEMTRLAPSASNKQPWRIVKEGDGFHFLLERDPAYQKRLQGMGYDLQRTDMGIAMCHFELTAKEAGLNGQWVVVDKKYLKLNENCEYFVSWKTL